MLEDAIVIKRTAAVWKDAQEGKLEAFVAAMLAQPLAQPVPSPSSSFLRLGFLSALTFSMHRFGPVLGAKPDIPEPPP